MAYVLSSVSGNLISAASAGYAPTNSGDVSAIASAYQVVSATGTKLYNGTYYLTSVNDNQLSAKYAVSASSATAAFYARYDRQGGVVRSLSSLPGSAEVSAIASAYAESAASGKQDTLTFSYDDDKISAINGSALAGQGGGGGATGDYVEKSATNLAIGSSVDAQNDDTFAQGRYCSSNYCGLAQGYHNRASSMSFAQGTYNNANGYSFAQGVDNTADSNGFAQGYKNKGSGNSFAQGNRNLAKACSFAQGDYSTASSVSFAQGSGVSATDTAVAFGTYNLSGNGSDSSGAAFVIGDGTASNARHDLMVVTKDGEITMYSGTADTTGTGIMSSIRAISAAATGGGIDSATVSAIASSYAESAVSSVSGNYYTTANESGFLTAQVQASWSESASASPSYIQDKPDLVDIVAGPGIVVDNPDGNTLRVSMGIAGSWVDVSTEASYNTTNINVGSFKLLYNPALNLVALTCDVNVGAGETTFFTWSNRLKPVFDNMSLGSNLYVGQSVLKQAAGSTSRWINGAFMWPVVGGN